MTEDSRGDDGTRPMKSMQTVQVVRDGKVIREETLEGALPDVQSRDPSQLSDMKRMSSLRASACVYCGSTKQLSREHVVPYALGGMLTILDGSCEKCRRRTHSFETDVLTGPMRMVRYIQNLPSSSKHQNVPKVVSLEVTASDGGKKTIEVPTEKAPIFLAFYEFGEPKYFDASRGVNLETGGVVTGSYGKDPSQFLNELKARGMNLSSPPLRPVAFARMIAKIAYCFALCHGHVSKLEDPAELIHAFMDEPDTIGRFVGSIPPPFLKFEGVGIRLAIKVLESRQIAYAEVQLFAASGAPTYIVILGKIKDGEELS